jgi:hypothetical protein
VKLRPIVPHGVDGPSIFDDEEGDPLPLVDVDEIPGAGNDGDGIDYEERGVEFKFVTRYFFVVSDVA